MLRQRDAVAVHGRLLAHLPLVPSETEPEATMDEVDVGCSSSAEVGDGETGKGKGKGKGSMRGAVYYEVAYSLSSSRNVNDPTTYGRIQVRRARVGEHPYGLFQHPAYNGPYSLSGSFFVLPTFN